MGFVNFKDFIIKKKKDILVAVLFIFIASASVLYSTTLPFTIHGDTYVTLLANKAVHDQSFPDRDKLLNFDFKPYLYTNILDFLGNHFDLNTYKLILLFLCVFLTGYVAYLAFRMLGFSISVSLVSSIVALVPRVTVGGEAFGVIVSDDVLGRTLGLPFLWLGFAWILRNKIKDKKLWPAFLFLGLSTYIHPVSIVLFTAIMFLVFLYWIFESKKYREGIQDFLYSVIAFLLGGVLLFKKILFVTNNLTLNNDAFPKATSLEYYKALMYRIDWDFLPKSIIYLKHFVLINMFFWVLILGIYYFNRKNEYTGLESKRLRVLWISSLLVVFLSVGLSLVLPNVQLYLAKNFDFPFVLQQSSRFFKYYYMGLYLLFAIVVEKTLQFFPKYKKILFAFFLIFGILSSTFFFECFQYVVGFNGFKKEYIPNYLQANKLQDDRVVYPVICKQIREAGINKTDLVMSDEFQLRYFCDQKLTNTYEEGTIYFMSGKNQLVWWYKNYLEQNHALYEGSSKEIIALAKKDNATYALLESYLPVIKEFEALKMVISKGDRFTIIKFK